MVDERYLELSYFMAMNDATIQAKRIVAEYRAKPRPKPKFLTLSMGKYFSTYRVHNMSHTAGHGKYQTLLSAAQYGYFILGHRGNEATSTWYQELADIPEGDTNPGGLHNSCVRFPKLENPEW